MSCCANFFRHGLILYAKPSKNAKIFGKNIHQFYHEHNNYAETHPIHTTCNEGSLQHRMVVIKNFVNKFCDYYVSAKYDPCPCWDGGSPCKVYLLHIGCYCFFHFYCIILSDSYMLDGPPLCIIKLRESHSLSPIIGNRDPCAPPMVALTCTTAAPERKVQDKTGIC